MRTLHVVANHARVETLLDVALLVRVGPQWSVMHSNIPGEPLPPDPWGGETDKHLIREVTGNDARAWLQLVERYRVPVRRMLRLRLRGDPSADDAADDFFSYLFQQQLVAKFDPGQGRFRCYIQGVIKLYARAWRRASTTARGEIDVLEFDVLTNGEDNEFERQEEHLWAESVLGHALERLTRESSRDAELIVRFYGLGGGDPVSGDKLARAMEKSDNALHVALHRARGKLHAALLDELRPMVSSREELVDEREFLVTRLLAAHPGLLAE